MAHQFVREPLGAEEADRLANASRSPEEKLIVWTLLDTGLRVSELCSLARDNQRHVTEEKLDEAITALIIAYNRLSLPKCWGSGKHASADGKQFPHGRQGQDDSLPVEFNCPASVAVPRRRRA
jgi:integrase